jgi:hypothetical protein
MPLQRIGGVPMMKVVGELSDVSLHGELCRDRPYVRSQDTFVYYDQVGDFAEFFVKRCPYSTRFIDSTFSVYHCRRTGAIIGAQLCGFSAMIDFILERVPGFRLEIRDNQVAVGAIFTASRWAKDDSLEEVNVDVYEEVSKIAQQVDKKIPVPI